MYIECSALASPQFGACTRARFGGIFPSLYAGWAPIADYRTYGIRRLGSRPPHRPGRRISLVFNHVLDRLRLRFAARGHQLVVDDAVLRRKARIRTPASCRQAKGDGGSWGRATPASIGSAGIVRRIRRRRQRPPCSTSPARLRRSRADQDDALGDRRRRGRRSRTAPPLAEAGRGPAVASTPRAAATHRRFRPLRRRRRLRLMRGRCGRAPSRPRRQQAERRRTDDSRRSSVHWCAASRRASARGSGRSRGPGRATEPTPQPRSRDRGACPSRPPAEPYGTRRSAGPPSASAAEGVGVLRSSISTRVFQCSSRIRPRLDPSLAFMVHQA